MKPRLVIAAGILLSGALLVSCKAKTDQKTPEQKPAAQVVWNYAYVGNPVVRTLSVENPDNDEALYAFPSARYFWCTPNYGQSHPGQNGACLNCVFPRLQGEPPGQGSWLVSTVPRGPGKPSSAYCN